MKPEDVIELYELLIRNGIKVWIDGGWCVDALLGKQTRPHPDLDIAIRKVDADKAHGLLESLGYFNKPIADAREWNYVMENPDEFLVDIHVFEFDNSGKNTYGVDYPKDSLTGTGHIGGKLVMCISPKWMFKVKTSYEPEQKDLDDVNALAKKFKIASI